MPRKMTNFAGWQKDVDYLAEYAEQQKRIEQAIELHQRMMREDEVRPLALKWRITIFVGAALLGSYVVWEVLTVVIDGLMRWFGR